MRCFFLKTMRKMTMKKMMKKMMMKKICWVEAGQKIGIVSLDS